MHGTKWPWYDSVIQDTVLHKRYRTTGRMEKMGMHNRSEDGCSARDTYLPTLLNLILNLQLIFPFVGYKHFLFFAFPQISPCVISVYKQSKVICIIHIFSSLMWLLKHAELGLCTVYSLCALQFKFLSVCRLGNIVLYINSICLLRPVFSLLVFLSKNANTVSYLELILVHVIHHSSIGMAGKGCCDLFSVYSVSP
jgi:hypothetical protein